MNPLAVTKMLCILTCGQYIRHNVIQFIHVLKHELYVKSCVPLLVRRSCLYILRLKFLVKGVKCSTELLSN